jgi:hypothetical protein
MIKLLIFTILHIFLIANSHGAEKVIIISATCDEPLGIRFDGNEKKIEQSEDKFTGINPQFIYSSANPNKLTVIWPDSKTIKNGRTNAHEAHLLKLDENQISGIALYENGRSDIYTLFINQGIGFMSSHKVNEFNSEVATGALYKFKCKYESD